MARNTQLLEQVMQHITDHPEQHDQSIWAREEKCGTAACFAGWAAIFTFGDRLTMIPEVGFRCPAPYADMKMSEVAAVLLGLETDEADELFAASNSADMLRLMVKDLVNGDELRSEETYEEEVEAA